MEFFKQWCFCVCVTLIIAVIFSLFTPKGRMKGFYKILISLFVFTSFIYPFKDFSIKALELPKMSVNTESGNAVYENTVDKQLMKLLRDNGVSGSSVSSDVSVDYKSGEITVLSVRVTVPDEYDTETVRKVIADNTGINAEVVHSGK